MIDAPKSIEHRVAVLIDAQDGFLSPKYRMYLSPVRMIQFIARCETLPTKPVSANTGLSNKALNRTSRINVSVNGVAVVFSSYVDECKSRIHRGLD